MVPIETLQRFPCFARLNRQNLRELALVTEEVTIPAGTRIFGEGEDADTLYGIVRGEVEIQYPLATGELCKIQTLSDGDILVWSAVVEPYKTTAVGVTNKDTELLAINARKLREYFFDKDPTLARAVLQQVAKMLATRLENARRELGKMTVQLSARD
jgi:CRP/FNR family cyclic AMP-dependent transcriptional regulator